MGAGLSQTTTIAMRIKTNEAHGFALWLESHLLNNFLPLTEAFPCTGTFIMFLLWFLWCLIQAEFVLQSFLTVQRDTFSLLCTGIQLYKAYILIWCL